VQRTVRGILDPYQLRFSPDMKWFVTAANRLNHVDIYRWDGKDMVLARRISTGKTPSHLWIDSKSTTVYVDHAGQRRTDRHRPGHPERSSGASRPARCRQTCTARRMTNSYWSA
jgi:hypothetical protein